MRRHNYLFDGADELVTMGSSWFIAYKYNPKATEELCRENGLKTLDNRISVYYRSEKHHITFINEICKMDVDKLSTNQLGISGEEIIRMARELRDQYGGKEKTQMNRTVIEPRGSIGETKMKKRREARHKWDPEEDKICCQMYYKHYVEAKDSIPVECLIGEIKAEFRRRGLGGMPDNSVIDKLMNIKYVLSLILKMEDTSDISSLPSFSKQNAEMMMEVIAEAIIRNKKEQRNLW